MKSEPEFYKPAEACKVAEVAPYVLRYWETEFPALSEGKEKGAARLYSGRDVKIISRIRELLYDEGFTVAGAKKRLEAEISEGRFDDGLEPAPPPSKQKAQPQPSLPMPVSEAPGATFLKENARTGTPSSTRAAASPAAGAGERAGFSERKRVLKELKEISKLLDRGRKAH
jgi:DNA-binding transcriptional MerR regulator